MPLESPRMIAVSINNSIDLVLMHPRKDVFYVSYLHMHLIALLPGVACLNDRLAAVKYLLERAFVMFQA